MAMSEDVAPTRPANPRGLPLQSGFAVEPADNRTGYRTFRAGSFGFRRDGYFAHIT